MEKQADTARTGWGVCLLLMIVALIFALVWVFGVDRAGTIAAFTFGGAVIIGSFTTIQQIFTNR